MTMEHTCSRVPAHLCSICTCFLFCKRTAEVQPREPGASSRRIWEEGGAGRYPILKSQVGDSEGGTRRTPPVCGGARVETRLVSLRFSALLPLAWIAATVQIFCVSLKSARVKNKLRFNHLTVSVLGLVTNKIGSRHGRKDSPLPPLSYLQNWGLGLGKWTLEILKAECSPNPLMLTPTGTFLTSPMRWAS